MAFWCDEQIVVTVEGLDGVSEIVLPQPFARVGNHPQSDVLLAGDDVARRALYLHATPEGLYCVDLDVPEVAHDAGGRWLAPDELLTIGPYRLRARLASGKAAGVAVDRGANHGTPGGSDLVQRGSSPNPLPVLNVFCGRLLKDKRRLRARLSLVGRRPQCAVRLRGHQVSSYHCALFWHERRLWCIDLNASNGTQLNGQPLHAGEVQLHDELEVGEFRLVYYRWSPRNWHAGEEAEGAARHDTWIANPDDERRAISTAGDVDAPQWAPTIFVPAQAEIDQAGDRSRGTEDRVAISGPVAVDREAHEGQRLVAEVERLAQERAELQARWEETSRQLTEQIEGLQAELDRLADEREAHSTAQEEWQSEREAITWELKRRSEELDRLKSELAAATASLAASNASQQAGGGAIQDHPFALSEGGDEGTGIAAEQNRLPTGVRPTEATSQAPFDREEPSPELNREASLTASSNGRRTKPRDELGTFVSDRLVEMQDRKRRRRVLLWSGAILALACASVVGSIVAWQMWG